MGLRAETAKALDQERSSLRTGTLQSVPNFPDKTDRSGRIAAICHEIMAVRAACGGSLVLPAEAKASINHIRLLSKQGAERNAQDITRLSSQAIAQSLASLASSMNLGGGVLLQETHTVLIAAGAPIVISN